MTDILASTGAHPRTRRPSLAEQSTEFRLAVMRLARRIRQERADAELSATQYAALAWTASEGPLTPGRLAELERVTPPSMNRTVNCLVESGLLVRESSPDDGRKVLLHATEAGHEIVRETRRRRDAWLAKRFATLSPDERDTLGAATDILRRLTDQ
ncbi:MarR family winged helix-turn-helix transcriptional regulator [Agromyces kandeliae]|uniref:MarR family transcriptional regulator n=1 Tax=Agromyces kandeliae TaxID=2666141 RepID=A0A6L5R239_9MICO|nr:MarR family transcriptional regulator [Agromyces kandeliae]MRX43077.1 MarR family transcriptional regulator [Agromyces kandeliae]